MRDSKRRLNRPATTEGPVLGTDPETPPRPTFERHYSVEEIAQIWNVSTEFVRRLFVREPGVVVFWRQQPGRRVYRTLRIPQSVAERVHRRMSEP